MAAAHCTTTAAAAAFRIHFATTTAAATKFSKMPLRLISSNYIPTPKRSTKRKNYLRQKLLKTLIKPPYPNTLTPEPPPTDSEFTLLPTPEKDSNFPYSDQFSGEPSPGVAGEEVRELEKEEFKQSEASASVEIVSGNVGNFPKNSAMKFGLWLVGAFVFQTIFAVWVFGSADFDEKFKSLESKNEKIDKGDVLERHANGNDDSRLKLDVNERVGFERKENLYADEDEMVKKIEEIKVLAREARERERVERKKNGSDGNDSDFEDEEEDDGLGKSEIEKEVFQRLQKLRTRLENDRMGYLKGDGEKRDGVGNEGLLFKKKYKFKGLLSGERDRPKGFSGLSDHGDGKARGRIFNSENEVLSNGNEVDGGVNMLDDKQGSPRDLHEGNLSRSAAMNFKDNGRKKGKSEASKSLKMVKKQEGRRVDAAQSKPPKVQYKNYGRLSVEKGNSRGTSVSDRHDQSLKSRGDGQKQSASNKKLDCETDWWLGLAYVLVILMRRGHDGEGQRGLYTLRGKSYTEDGSSQIVAFADRGDATNFCYLLQSFFEDVGDFSTDIIPLSTKELKEMKSETKKVIVVRKGQLLLYAGQPLADVEMALRSLVEQSS